MSDLRELYQEMILDHSKHPRNFGEMPQATRKAVGVNPLCGDKATVFLTLDGDTVKEVSFVGSGCSISQASASMMTESIKGKSRAEAEGLFDRFHQLLTADSTARKTPPPDLGKLTVFSGVCEFPIRVKCATLPWHTLKAALHSEDQQVTTE